MAFRSWADGHPAPRNSLNQTFSVNQRKHLRAHPGRRSTSPALSTADILAGPS